VLLLGEFNGMSSQSHVSRCRVGLLPLGEFTVMIPEPHATLQGAVTWRNQCHDRATLQGVRIPSAILKIVFRHNLFFCFLNAVLALTSGGILIISDTVVIIMKLPGNRMAMAHRSHIFCDKSDNNWNENTANQYIQKCIK